jgi:hypothetical protein
LRRVADNFIELRDLEYMIGRGMEDR